jgi:dihydroorotase
MVFYDLLISGGYLVDPANGREGRFDLAIEGGKVVRVEQGLSRDLARQVYEAGHPGRRFSHAGSVRSDHGFGLCRTGGDSA